MKLVDYSSGSDASDSEDEQIPSPPPAPKIPHATLPAKPAKKQIIVDLPKPSRTEDEEPAKKRPRPEGGGGGLFAVLPPPKRSKTAQNGTVKQETGDQKDAGNVTKLEETPLEKEVPTTTESTVAAPSTAAFVPRSTAAKKGKPVPRQKIVKEPAVSLFPLGPDLVPKPTTQTISTNPSTYEPLIAQPLPPRPPTDPFPADEPEFIPDTTIPQASTISTSDLDSFAAHILEGRHRKNRTIEIVDYNAAEVYAQNAADKASGLLQDQIQPVRAIGSGRHQLGQLLNNVQDQRESLEEAFAQGRKIRKETAARYGW